MKKSYKIYLLFFIVNCTLLTANCYSQWTQLPNLPITGTVWDMYFTNPNTGWITLVTPTAIIKTTDGGQNWITQSNISIRNIQFLDDNTGYGQGFIGTNGTIWKTTNGGTNWNSVLSDGNSYADISFVNKDTGWACGTDSFLGGIWITTDGGLSFQRQFTSTTGSLDRIFFLKAKGPGGYIGWCAAMPKVYKTTNSGASWNLVYNGVASFCNGSSTSDMYFKDSLNGVITRGGNCFNITTDGGFNWTLINEQHTLSGKIASVNTTGWITLSTDSIIKTTNFFQSYGKQPIPIPVSRIFAVDSLVVYAGYDQTSIIKTTNGGGNISAIEQISTDVPENFYLYQNYPNPFNPSTKIKFDISKTSFVKITIYNILGEEIAEIVNEELNPGKYETQWEADNYSSGMYFYKLQTGDYTETKKMLMIK